MPDGKGFGMGFGFKGYSPPWPYIGRGRGGLPRCRASGAYYGTGYPYPEELQSRGITGFWPSVPPDQEVAILKNQAEMLRQQLEQIGSRIKALEKRPQ